MITTTNLSTCLQKGFRASTATLNANSFASAHLLQCIFQLIHLEMRCPTEGPKTLIHFLCQSDRPWIANPTGTATRTRSLPKHCACAAKRHVELEKLRFAHRANENSTCRSIKNTHRRRIPMAHAYRLTANGFGRLRTVANSGTTPDEHGLHPQTPTYKREPFATHSGNTKNTYAQIFILGLAALL